MLKRAIEQICSAASHLPVKAPGGSAFPGCTAAQGPGHCVQQRQMENELIRKQRWLVSQIYGTRPAC